MLIIHDEVATALREKRGVVALESTVIAHGLSYPENLAIAHKLDHVIRQEGATPALIALIDSNIHVGLESSQLEKLADPQSSVTKVSSKDIAFTLANKNMGATTVSATMLIAHRAGIKIFATGGIGGVHRGVEKSMDISTDLYELSRTPVAVVCAGAKSILDVPKTLEVLESLGVPVWGFGTNKFPEFFCPGELYNLDTYFMCINKLVSALKIHQDLGLKSGIVICQPVPAADALDKNIIESIVQEALKSAGKAHIQGKAVTPFVLKEIMQKSQGKSLEANKALLIANATLAARIAAKIIGE